MNEFADIIFKRVDGADYSTIRNDIKLFSVFLAFDGRRSVRTIASDDGYELRDLAARIDRMEKLGLIAAVDGTERDYVETPAEITFKKLPKEFRTGIEAVDKQHQRLVDMVNHLGRARKTTYKDLKHKQAAIGHVVGEMLGYTVSHFAFEESLMQEAKYKFFQSHKRVHELFVARANEYQRRFMAGEDIVNELFDVLNRWLFNHIRNDDLAYAPVVKKKVQELDATKGDWLGRMLKRFFK
jgi:hemerythrin